MAKGFRTRFAPSPTGLIHLGTAYSALFVRREADRNEGDMLLRIEDIDQTRCRREYEIAMLEDLTWLGLRWDGSLRRQSDHFESYRNGIGRLIERGLVYRCFRTRRDIAEAKGHPAAIFEAGPLSPVDEAERLNRGDGFAWRLSLKAARAELGHAFNALSYQSLTSEGVVTSPAKPALSGDVVLARKDTPVAYHYAACHDDAAQDITHVIRGQDLEDAVHIHTLLQVLMDWPRPIYQHHSLLWAPDGRKLSKRDQAKSLATLRQEGLSAADIRIRLGF